MDPGLSDRPTLDLGRAEQEAVKQERLMPKPGLADTFKAAWRAHSVESAALRHFEMMGISPDASYNPMEEQEWKRLTEGLPQHLHGEFIPAMSRGEADAIRANIQRSLEDDATLARSPYGTAMGVGVELLDPATVVAGTATGGAGWGMKASRITRMLTAGSVNALTNMAIEEHLARANPTRDQSSTAVAGFWGFLLGGTIGGLLPSEMDRVRKAASDGAKAVDLQAIKTSGTPGLQVTPKGEAELAAEAGFEAGSVGSAQIESIVPGERFGKFKVGRFEFQLPRISFSGRLGNSPSKAAQLLAADMIPDSVGYKAVNGKAVPVRRTASEIAEITRRSKMEKMNAALTAGFVEYAKARGLNRLTARKQELQFRQDVTRIVWGDEELALKNPQAAKVAQTVQRIHAEQAEGLKKAGVEGAEDLQQDLTYMSRQWDQDKITRHFRAFKKEDVEAVVANAIRARQSIEGTAEEIAQKTKELSAKADGIARAILDTIRRAGQGTVLSKLNVGKTRTEALRQEMGRLGVEEQYHDDVISFLTGQSQSAKDASGKPSTLRHRVDLDPLLKTTIVDKDGVAHDVSVADMLETDALRLTDKYVRQTSGMIGAAKVGIRSDSDFAARLKEIDDEGLEKALDGEKVARAKEDLQMVYDHMMGRPIGANPGSKWEKARRIIGGLNFMGNMGQAGVASISEIGNMLGFAGTRAFALHSPAFRHIVTMAKKGQIPDDLARDIEAVGGFNADWTNTHAFSREFDEPALSGAGFADRAEVFTQEGAKVIADLSGLNLVNNSLRQVVSRVLLQRFVDFSRGLGKIDDKVLHRMASSGLSKRDLDEILPNLKKFTEVDEAGKVERIHWEDWQLNDPETAEKFHMAWWREAYRVVQEPQIGDTAPWMHSTLGKVLTQFRVFSLVSLEKQLYHGLNHMDQQTIVAWLGSMVFGGLAYVAQTSVNYAHNAEALEERLTTAEIAKAAFQRAGFSTLIPGAIDTVADLTTGDGVFKNGRTTNLGTGFIMGNSYVDRVATKALGTLQNLTRSAFDEDHTTTRQDVKNSLGLFLPNLLLIRNATDAIASEYPNKSLLAQ